MVLRYPNNYFLLIFIELISITIKNNGDIFMAKMHQVGKVHHGVSFEQLSVIFKEKSWAGATTNDRIS